MLSNRLDSDQVFEDKILVAVSGGADSVALFRGLMGIREQHRIELMVGHFDHALRPDSANDAEWVRELCQRWQVPCWIGRTDQAERNSEERARQQRYEFLTRTAIAHHCGWIAVAHTASDQAETVLHHILRGTGLKGLTGIPAVRRLTNGIRILRPLLAVSRQEVLAFLNEFEQDYRVDSSNESNIYTRNRLRNELLPHLRQEFNPRVEEALVRLSDQARESQTAIETIAGRLLADSQLEIQRDCVRLSRQTMFGQPRAVIRELFVQLWQAQDWPRQELSAWHLDQLADMALTSTPPRHSLPGRLDALSRGNVLTVRRHS
ncbi:MAG: tRNA lysidine(34) synthetase TilS [Planctomycetaceae bacterium]|nr:tRNA lysidine(34) synthetase TilS [Planctomycetaceae bacterium]